MEEILQIYRGVGTAILLVMFIGMVIWAYSRKPKAAFSEAELLPFDKETAEQIKANREETTHE
ncbi:MAG: cbb3-type cytochrome c oxidase subunit 3 [Gammaproteobacteria bacterium]|jgi:cytochrome c oxidase cbb3-type subunit 4